MAFILAGLFGIAPQVPSSVATSEGALAAMGNPAGLAVSRGFDFCFLYNLRSAGIWENSSFCASLGTLGGFWEPGDRYGVALGLGRDGYCGGIRFAQDTATRWDMGVLFRPTGWLSLGTVWADVGHGWGGVRAGAGVRPIGNRLTLTADVLAAKPAVPVIGFEAEPLDGLVLVGMLKPTDRSFSLGLRFGLGNVSLGAVRSQVGDVLQAGALVRVGQEKRRSLIPQPRRFLELRLSGSAADQKPGFSLTGSRPARTTWELLDLIRKAADDKNVAGIVLKLDGFSAGVALAQEVRSALAEFRAKGKMIFVYAASLGMQEFYIASVADRIFCYPLGEVVIPGVTSTSLFLKGALDKLGIEPDAIRHGKYKSAVEMFTEDSLSEPNREQIEAALDVVYNDFLEQAGTGRAIGRDSLERLVSTGFFSSREARECGLVDALCYPDELDSILRKEVVGFRKVTEQVYRSVLHHEYDWQTPQQVAVVYASGRIASGESGTDFLSGELTMGANTIVRALAAARRNRKVKAVVLRVDSPGGDGYASDLIWREVELCRRKKPVVVSMGNVAASGGYYISCSADRIFASPGTVTGSIGVFSLRFITEGLYEKLGISRQVVKRGERADAGSDLRRLTPQEESLFTRQIDEFYRQFVDKVATGRKLGFEQVDSVAQGRVWMGADAHKVGLVDSIGGMLAALEWARLQAKLKECDYVFYPRQRSGPGAMLEEFFKARMPRMRPWP